MAKTAQFIEESKSVKEPKPRKTNPRSLANLVKPWPKGVSGNPGGKNQHDIAERIAQAVFSENEEEIYKALAAVVLSGNPYAFKEVSDRAFGKLKERREVTHVHQDVPDTDLEKRISELLTDLGLAAQIDAAGGTEKPQTGAGKTNGHAKDSDLLPR